MQVLPRAFREPKLSCVTTPSLRFRPTEVGAPKGHHGHQALVKEEFTLNPRVWGLGSSALRLYMDAGEGSQP